MSKKRKITLNGAEYILTAYAKPTCGPGWANAAIWVVVHDPATGKMRDIALQPDEQTREMRTIYSMCAESHRVLMAEVASASRVSNRNKTSK